MPTETKCGSHELTNTYAMAAQGYMERIIDATGAERYKNIRYEVFEEADRVAVLGSAQVDGEPRTWAQVFRIDEGKVVETWWSGWSLSLETVKALADITGLG